jgi:apolipoprotein N-acyltransferase
MPAQGESELWRPGRSALRGVVWIGAAIVWITAAVIAIVVALFFAATIVAGLLMAGALVTLAAAAARARRSVRPQPHPDVIEARRIGGHSWVAYGWDGRR